MFKSTAAFLLAVFVLIFASFIPVMAQDLPILEEDFLYAELLVVYCFDGTDNYYDYLDAETSEEELEVLVDGVGLDEDTALGFMTEIDTLSEELGEDIDVVTAKSWFYAAVIVHCFGEEGLATVVEAEDPEYYIIYFGLDEEAASYFYYLYEETYYYISVEIYLIDMGVDPAFIDEILFLLDDPEELNAYFVEIGIEIDVEVFFDDLEVLEADAEDDFTEDEAYVEEDEDGEGEEGDAEEGDEEGDGEDGEGDAEEGDEGEEDDGSEEEGDEEEGDDGGEEDGGEDDGGEEGDE